MSPEIRINGQLIADVPDETGWHQALDGSPLHVNVDQLDARNKRQIIGLEGSSVGGERIVRLTQEGKENSRKGGDGKSPTLEVTLHDRPIRVTYSPRVPGTERLVITPYGGLYVGYDRGNRRTLYNPRWMK